MQSRVPKSQRGVRAAAARRAGRRRTRRPPGTRTDPRDGRRRDRSGADAAANVDVSRLEVLDAATPAEIVRGSCSAVDRAGAAGARLAAAARARARARRRPLRGRLVLLEESLRELKRAARAAPRARRARAARPGLSLGQLLLNRPWPNAVAPLLEPTPRRQGLLPGSAPSLGDRSRCAPPRSGGRRERLREGRRPRARRRPRERRASLPRRRRLAASPDLYARGTQTIQTLAPITLAGFRDALGMSRRVAQLLLERYDADGLTRRVGDERVLRRAARR